MEKMKKSAKVKAYCLAVLIIAALMAQMCPAVSFRDGDFQYWSINGGSVDIDENWTITAEEELRFVDNASEFYYQHTDVGVVYKNVVENVDLGFNFRKAFTKISRDNWNSENRTHLNLTIRGELFDMPVSNRSRFEYRDIDESKNLFRYRNKFTINFPLEFTQLKLKPYLAEEVYINCDEDGFNKNKVYAGLKLKLADNIDGSLFYLWQTRKPSGSGWGQDINVIGTALKIRF